MNTREIQNFSLQKFEDLKFKLLQEVYLDFGSDYYFEAYVYRYDHLRVFKHLGFPIRDRSDLCGRIALNVYEILFNTGYGVSNVIPLTKAQQELMAEFYSLPKSHVDLVKNDRKLISAQYKLNRTQEVLEKYKVKFPAIYDEIEKSLSTGKLEQGAIISECVYAQTLANHFGLADFTNYTTKPQWLSKEILSLLNSYSLKPRYVFKNRENTRLLIQAGGPAGIDSALISVIDNNVYTIEFKESLAKSSEADLPTYGEDGLLVLDDKFRRKWPQFLSMVNEQIEKRLNFFDHIGSNINDFSSKSIREAVIDNYSGKKFADVICTEDVAGFLTMIPANQADVWGPLEGEIRPSGRNSYKVWTPNRLKIDIEVKGGTIQNNIVRLPVEALKATPPRGGTGISRYKINSLFFVKSENIKNVENFIEFDLKHIKQNKPTISAKMDFKEISYEEVKKYYFGKMTNG